MATFPASRPGGEEVVVGAMLPILLSLDLPAGCDNEVLLRLFNIAAQNGVDGGALVLCPRGKRVLAGEYLTNTATVTYWDSTPAFDSDRAHVDPSNIVMWRVCLHQRLGDFSRDSLPRHSPGHSLSPKS